jgi:hypothetical protein
MKFDEVLRIVAEQGASHIIEMSAVWYIVYRPKNGKYQARSLNKVGEDEWQLSDHMVASKDFKGGAGWHVIEHLPARAETLEVPEPPEPEEAAEAEETAAEASE